MSDVAQFFGVMMSLLATGLIGFGGVVMINRLRRAGTPALTVDEVELFRAQIGESEELRDRVAELEERLDFTERMLAGGSGTTPRFAPGSAALHVLELNNIATRPTK